jgi:ElaB/YqjD/DUF883 family membrane-anchored ribosome-binding protein
MMTLEDGWDLVREKTSTGAERLWELAREHPLPTVTAGLGLGWLIIESARGGPLLPWSGRRRRAGGGSGSARLADAGTRALRGLGELLEERPLAVAGASLAVGMLAGLALPATRREDELLGDTRDELLESAREAGKDALEKGKEAAAGAVERVKESVREQELTPEQLADKARQVARDAADAVLDAERQVARSLAGEEPAEGNGVPLPSRGWGVSA